MRIAVVGCSHGQLDTIYKTIHRIDAEAKKSGELPVELLLCCGDFQAGPSAVHSIPVHINASA